MQSVQTPVIPVVAELIRAHPGTISLGQGVVHYGPPRQAIDAIGTFLADPENNKYKAVHGIAPLLSIIERKLAEENGIAASSKTRLFVTPGGNMGFMNAILAIADPGDEIILVAPYYFNHEMAVVMANCRPVVVNSDDNYQPRLEALSAAVSGRTRAIVTISPNNPSGAVYPQATLRAINSLCRERGIYHIHDEVYEYFIWGDAKHFSPASMPQAAEHTITIFSLSKAYGFASWRVGYMVIPADLFEAMRKIQDTMLVCPPVISQFAGVGAMTAGRAYCREQMRSIEEVRGLVQEALAKIGHIATVPEAWGAFYFFARVHCRLEPMVLVERLIREHGVAVLPGTTFGMSEGCYLRIAYGALQKETVAEGIGRFVKGIKSIVQ